MLTAVKDARPALTSDTMRSIDQAIGPPICLLLSMFYRIVRLIKPGQRGRVRNARRVLFVKPAEMGSTVLTYPTVLRTRQLWPDCEIFFLVFAENRQAVDLLGMVPAENIITLRTDGFLHFAIDCIRGIVRLRRLKLDVAVDMEFFSRAAAILAVCAGARATAGFHRYTMEGLYTGSLFTHPVEYNCHLHVTASFLSLVEALDQEAGQKPLAKVKLDSSLASTLPRFSPTTEETQKIQQLIKEQHPDVTENSRLVILNVNSSDLMPLRRWPLSLFIELGKRLLESPGTVIVLTGMASELEESLKVAEQLGPQACVSMVGKTTLRELLTLFTLCDLLVTNDSGPSHFAALTDMPSITLFGPETSELYGPLDEKRTAIMSGLACSPCVSAYNHRRSPCKDNACMKAITVDEVYRECDRLWSDAPPQNERT